MQPVMSLDSARPLKVALRKTGAPGYPLKSPFDPPERYPELPETETDPSNLVYASVRALLLDLGFDAAHAGTKAWNPLGEMIRPGMTVFLKPNTVVHEHEKKTDLFSILVHPSVLRPILDYVGLALRDQGTIIVGDSPLYTSNYDKMLLRSGLGEFLEWYRSRTKADLQWFDLRLNKARRTWLYGRWGRTRIERDPRGYRFVDLGEQSCFVGIDPSRLRISMASHRKMAEHHSRGKHEYCFPVSFLQSDVVINIAKLKTHRRTGVTLALKNYMGLPAYKDSLPHFQTGSPEEGGDQYIHRSRRKRLCTRLHDIIQTSPSIPLKFLCAIAKKAVWNSRLLFPFKDDVSEAMWWGNDTVWRTLHDLNRAVIYADKDGLLRNTPQRSQFVLIDGITGGEGDGPVACDPLPADLLMAGINPVGVDAVAASAMGFDVAKIPLIRNAFGGKADPLPLIPGAIENILVTIEGGEESFDRFLDRPFVCFRPHKAWKGHIERRREGERPPCL